MEVSAKLTKTLDLEAEITLNLNESPSSPTLELSSSDSVEKEKEEVETEDEETSSEGDDYVIDVRTPIADQSDTHGDSPSTIDGDLKHVQGNPDTPRSIIGICFDTIKYVYSFSLLVFSVVILATAICTGKSGAASYGIHPIAAFFVFWFLIIWLTVMEGGQGCLVGIQPINNRKYVDSHPVTYLNLLIVKRGDNLEKFIVGRQFLVAVTVFLINMIGSVSSEVDLLNLSKGVKDIFLSTGLALSLTTIMLGQLTSQVNAAVSMLDFVNNMVMMFTTYVALIVEGSGLLHSVYLVQIIFSKLTGKPIESNEPEKTIGQKIFFWVRVLLSLAILGFSFAVTLEALLKKQTTMWGGVNEAAAIVIFFFLMAIVGMMEGMQIALFSVVNMPEEELRQHTTAHRNSQLVFSGNNLGKFLIGRQIFAATGMFVVAKITSLDVAVGTGENIFGVSDVVQKFFNTGLLGAILFTIVASLIWRIIAASYPLVFLSNPLIYILIRLCLLVEQSGLCSASWILARYQRIFLGYQPDAVYLRGAEKLTAAPANEREKIIDNIVKAVKYIYSSGLLIFSVTVVMATIGNRSTKLSAGAHPAISIVLFWFLLIWLAVMEGGLGCLVGLQPVDKSLYAESHPISHKSTTIVHKGDNMERFIVGRQFLVVLVMFIVNMCGGALPGTSDILNLPEGIVSVFVSSGLAMILTTIILGQLTSQVNAAKCMLDFLNKYFMLFTVYISLFIEFSGLLHSVYLVQIIFSKLTGNKEESNDRKGFGVFFFWARVLISCVILGFSFAVTLEALFKGQTTMWGGVPGSASVIIFFLLMAIVGMMEGMQIALFSVVNMPEEELRQHTTAHRNSQLVFSGNNLGKFLIGRQIFAATGMFVVAKITSLDVAVGTGENIFGVSDMVQTFFNTGLLGAIITTIVASLIWRVVASSFPIFFLSNPLIYIFIRLSLILESTGVCAAAWLLALIHKKIARYQEDETYIGPKKSNEEEV